MLQTICDLFIPNSATAVSIAADRSFQIGCLATDDQSIDADLARSSFSVFVIFFYLQMIGVVLSIVYALILFNIQMS